MDELDLGATIRGFIAGQKLFGRYTLIRQLGRGGMGVVWRARDESLERDVAIKMLPEMVANDPASVRELKRETSRNQQLSHPHILRVYDFAEGAGLCGITMEIAEGGTLTTRRLDQPGEVFEPAQLGPWLRQLCEALDYAHQRGKVVHRDLKPANLMLTADDELKVTDFGIAASLSESVTRVSKQAGSSGTPVYMSPQQMMGDKPAVTDDIYALGATLYELLTGKPPFYAGNVMLQVQSKRPPTLAERRSELGVTGAAIPPEWEQTIAACLAKEPKERPRSAGELAERLGLTMDRGRRSEDRGQKPEDKHGARHPDEPRKADVPSVAANKRKPATFMPIVIAAVFGLGGLGWYFGMYAPEQKRLAEQVRIKAEQAAASVGFDPDAYLAKAKAQEEQKIYTDIVAKIDAFVDGSPATLRASTDAAVKAYLAEAPPQFRPEVETRWSDRQSGWEAALKREQEKTSAQRLAQISAARTEYEHALLNFDRSMALWNARLVSEQDKVRAQTAVETAFAKLAAVDTAVAGKGMAYLLASPSTATIRVGELSGVGKLVAQNLAPGSHTVSVELAGYNRSEVVITVQAGRLNVPEQIVLEKEAARQPLSGQKWTIPDMQLDLMPIAPGTFQMGSASGGDKDERPITQVTLTKPFWLGKTEVTQAQWVAVMGSNPSNFQGGTGGPATQKIVTEVLGRNFKGGNLPVENVSWNDAMEFCRKLTERERAAGRLPDGYAYSLPTEAQWEYACRAGTTGDYAGNLDAMGWYDKNGGKTTHPVGQKQANAWGLHDMHGNVWEWCLDWYGNYSGGSVTDPTGPQSGSDRVNRSGSWVDATSYCRSSDRNWTGPGLRFSTIGFRLALVISDVSTSDRVAQSGSGQSYTVKAGDTFARIAAASGVSIDELLSVNPVDPAKLRVGQVLQIPNSKAASLVAITAEIRVSVVGQVGTPGQITLARGANILAAVSKAGGFTQLANRGTVKLTRISPDGHTTTSTLDVKGMLEGRITEIPLLEEGDVIYVPERLI